MPHKYKAKPTEVDGIRFASQKEARRYQELKLLERAGEIQRLELQPRFELRVNSTRSSPMDPDGPIQSAKIGEYRGDFSYSEWRWRATDRGREREWRTVVEDVKGFKTPLYKWKKKHVEAQYGIQIREI